eukprot:jgi/Mesen1/5713/ME000289S04811
MHENTRIHDKHSCSLLTLFDDLLFVQPVRASQCYPGTLDAAQVNGKIVICNMGGNHAVEKGQAVLDAGGRGMILVNEMSDARSMAWDFHRLPAVNVDYYSGQAIIEYANTERLPKASIAEVATSYGGRAPMIDGTSTRGPITSSRNSGLNYVLKPDLAAPGVEIWGAWTGDQTLRGAPMTSNVLSGTSQAAPHVAGAAALVRQAHPGWSAFAVKSALMTSARSNDRGGDRIRVQPESPIALATPFAMGSGFLDPAQALDPGLVFESTREEMVQFLLGVDPVGTHANLYVPPGVEPISPRNLNLPNVALTGLDGNGYTAQITRVVKSVSTVTETYTAQAYAPPGTAVTVTPRTFTIAPGGRVTYVIGIQRSPGGTAGAWSHGWTTFVSANHNVHQTMSVYIS